MDNAEVKAQANTVIKVEPLKPDKWVVKIIADGKEIGIYKLTINKNGKPCLN
jgi:hypothetical protein